MNEQSQSESKAYPNQAALKLGIRRYISAAFEHEASFMERFAPTVLGELNECYMASERTRVVFVLDTGQHVGDYIRTDEFMDWVDFILDNAEVSHER